MGKAEGIELENADAASWESAMSAFRKAHPATPRRQPNPLASLSLHARRLVPPEDMSDGPIK